MSNTTPSAEAILAEARAALESFAPGADESLPALCIRIALMHHNQHQTILSLQAQLQAARAEVVLARSGMAIKPFTLTEDAKFELIESMRQRGGSFVQALAECLLRADATNFNILVNAFPRFVSEYLELAENKHA